MAKAKRNDEWNRTSYILAKMHNAWRGQDDKPMSPNDCNPMIPKKQTERNEQPAARVGSSEFKAALQSFLKRGRK